MGRRVYAEEELLAFERAKGVSLPSAYRSYLLKVGAGAKVSLLEDWCQPYSEAELPSDFLTQRFPHSAPWNDLRLLSPAHGWRSQYFDPLFFCGAIRIANLGCEAYRLLVVSGPERGNIWCDDRVRSNGGIYPIVSWRAKRLTVDRYLRRWFWC